jgi:hypothetical protein
VAPKMGKITNRSFSKYCNICVYELIRLEKEPVNIDEKQEITLDLIKKMVDWDKRNKKLKDHHFRFMWNVANNKQPLDERAKKYASMNLKFIKRFGFHD